MRSEMVEAASSSGVDGIISDLPTQLRALLAERGAAWHPVEAPRYETTATEPGA